MKAITTQNDAVGDSLAFTSGERTSRLLPVTYLISRDLGEVVDN
jgi:hypothetical protein